MTTKRRQHLLLVGVFLLGLVGGFFIWRLFQPPTNSVGMQFRKIPAGTFTMGSPTPETCNNVDDNCNGSVDEGVMQGCYTGPAGTSGVGPCHGGTTHSHSQPCASATSRTKGRLVGCET